MSITCFAAMVFYVGSGDYIPNGSGYSSILTEAEKCYVERVRHRFENCNGSPDCNPANSAIVIEAINYRRKLKAKFRNSLVFDALRRPCEAMDNNLNQQRDCFKQRSEFSDAQGMRAASYARAGVSRKGFSQLRTGMSLDDVEFILGSRGARVSYVSSGGMSIGTYRWSSGKGSIIVSFRDDLVGGYTQIGLF